MDGAETWQCEQKNPSFWVCSSSSFLQPHLAWHLTVGRFLIPRSTAKYLIWIITQKLSYINAHDQLVCIFYVLDNMKMFIKNNRNFGWVIRFWMKVVKFTFLCFLTVVHYNSFFQLKKCFVERFKLSELSYLCLWLLDNLKIFRDVSLAEFDSQ